MGNCLVTKLKGIVDNENLTQLGHIRIKAALDDAGALIVKPVYGKTVTLKTIGLTPEVSLIADYNTPDLTFIDAFANVPKGTIIDISSKYDIHQLSPGLGSKWIVNLDDLKYSPVDFLTAYGNSNLSGSIENAFKLCTAVYACNVRNSGAYGNISIFAGKVSSFLSGFELNLASCPGIYGDLANLIDFSGAKINIIGTQVTTTQATLDALEGRGIQITYDQSQVIG